MINFDALKKATRISVSYITDDINGDYVKEFRRKYGLTQIALANIMGVKKKAIEKWEQGVNPVKGSSAVLLTLLSNNKDLLQQIRKATIISVDGKEEEFKVFATTSYQMKINVDIRPNEDYECIAAKTTSSYSPTRKTRLAPAY